MMNKVLVAGVGNIFLGDDGFGVAVANKLCEMDFPPEALVKDFGIASIHLVFELLNGYEVLILIDAVQTGETPGTLSCFEIDQESVLRDEATIADAHTMNPTSVVKLLNDFGGKVDTIYLVGCEPESIEETISLSPSVTQAVDEAVEMTKNLLATVLTPI